MSNPYSANPGMGGRTSSLPSAKTKPVVAERFYARRDFKLRT